MALGDSPKVMGKGTGPSVGAWLCHALPGCGHKQPWVMFHGVRGTLHRQGHLLLTPPAAEMER